MVVMVLSRLTRNVGPHKRAASPAWSSMRLNIVANSGRASKTFCTAFAQIANIRHRPNGMLPDSNYGL